MFSLGAVLLQICELLCLCFIKSKNVVLLQNDGSPFVTLQLGGGKQKPFPMTSHARARLGTRILARTSDSASSARERRASVTVAECDEGAGGTT
jgi:hypothetical protein